MQHFKTLLSLILMILQLIFTSIACHSSENPRPAPTVGGHCEYKTYRGEAEIVSVKHTKDSGKNFEVRFVFQTDETIKEKHGYVEGKENVLLMSNSSYPGRQFLRKYGIDKGKRFECRLKVITRGSCSPVLFDFPSINLNDY